MKSLLFFLTCIISFPFLLSAQNVNSVSHTFLWTGSDQFKEFDSALNKININYADHKLTYQNIEGNPYLSKEKVNGYVVLNDGNMINDVTLQYDMYAQEIIAENKLKEDIVLDGRIYQEVGMEIDGKTVIFKKTNPKNNKFHEVLYERDDKIVFYKKHYASIKEGSNYGMAKTEPKFSHRINYYVSKPDGSIVKVNLKKKESFLEAFPEIEAITMQKYLKKHKIKLKKEKDYVEFLTNLNNYH